MFDSVEGSIDGLADGLANGSLDGLADESTYGLADGLVDGLLDGLTDGLTDGLAGAGGLLSCLKRRGHSYLYGDESRVLLLISLLGHESVLHQREFVFPIFTSQLFSKFDILMNKCCLH